MSVFKKLGDEIADLSQLNVQTFSGDLKTVIADDDGSVIDWKKLLANAKSSGEVKLMASAQINFDGDSDNYFAADIPPDMLNAHLTAIEAGQKVRAGLIDMFKDALKIVS